MTTQETAVAALARFDHAWNELDKFVKGLSDRELGEIKTRSRGLERRLDSQEDVERLLKRAACLRDAAPIARDPTTAVTGPLPPS